MKTKANYSNRSALRNLILSSIVLFGCAPKPTIEMKVAPTLMQDKELEQVANYSVTRVAVFEDDLAYGKRRGIYEIVDNRTGKKYIGISGISICEVGSHSAGKSTVQDER